MKPKNLILMQQVHGNNVAIVDKKDIGTTIPRCDAMITRDSSVILGVRTADCLPISVVDKKDRGIGVIHAGWKGLDNKIIAKAIIELWKKLNVQSEDLVVNIGPHICQKHYEVKMDVSSKFLNYPDAVKKENDKMFLDLGEVARQQLISEGVSSENISIGKECTYENKNLFSYRRNGRSEGNLFTLNVKSG